MRVWSRWPTDGLLRLGRTTKVIRGAHWAVGGGGGHAHGKQAAGHHVPSLEVAGHPPG